MAYEIKFVSWTAQTATDVITLGARYQKFQMGAGQGNAPVNSTISIEGYTQADVESMITLFNRNCELIAPVSESGRKPWWAYALVRFSIALRQEVTHGSGTWLPWWYSDIVYGIATPDPRHFDEGMVQTTGGYCTLQFAHKPFWYRPPVAVNLYNDRAGQGTPGSTGWLTLDNETGPNGTCNFAGMTPSVTDPGDSPCLVEVLFRNPVNDSSHKPNRVHIGVLKGYNSFASRLGTFNQTAIAAVPYSYTGITLSANTVTTNMLKTLWSGYCRPMLMCDDGAPAGLEAMVLVQRDSQTYEADQQWWPLEQGRSMHALPTVRLPTAPIVTDPSPVQLVLRVRNLGVGSVNLPAGKFHIFPTDGWLTFDTSLWPLGYQDELRCLQQPPVTHVYSSSYAKFDTVVTRGEQLLLTPEQPHCFVVAWERSTGAASHTTTGELKINVVPRRRSI